VLKIVSAVFGRASIRRCSGYTYDDCYNSGPNITNVVRKR
jgi:hypothetical protein